MTIATCHRSMLKSLSTSQGLRCRTRQCSSPDPTSITSRLVAAAAVARHLAVRRFSSKSKSTTRVRSPAVASFVTIAPAISVSCTLNSSSSVQLSDLTLVKCGTRPWLVSAPPFRSLALALGRRVRKIFRSGSLRKIRAPIGRGPSLRRSSSP